MRFSSFAGQKVFLFGLGSSGLATAKALADGGAELTVWDDNPKAAAAAKAAGLRAQDLRPADWGGVKALILSPGVPLTHPKPHWSAELAKAAGAEIIGDIELFFRQRRLEGMERDCPLIAITGTNGKSTTTALTAHLLRAAGRRAEMGGNIGKPVAELADFAPGQIYVLELSSYQIDLTPSLKPTVGILLNITPDHIDRHGSFAHYAAVKERLVAAAETAIISAEDAPCRVILGRLEAAGKKVVNISAAAAEREAETLINGNNALRGRHNRQNAGAAIAACRAVGAAGFERGFADFRGLPHRMEEAGVLDFRGAAIRFINDSKATNAESAAPALRSFKHIYWIAGGRPKAGGIDSLGKDLAHVEKAYLIGEAADDFARTLANEKFAAVKCGTLAAAMQQAVADAEADIAAGEIDAVEGAAILLSPACASFDQFNNFEERGAAFAALARQYCRKNS